MKKKISNTQIPSGLKHLDVNTILRKRGIFFKQKINQELKEAAMPLAKQLLAKKATPKLKSQPEARKYAHFSDEEALAYQQKQIHSVEIIEEHFQKKIIQFLNKVQSDALANLEHEVLSKKSIKKVIIKDLFDEQDFVVQAGIDFTPLLENLSVIAGQEAYRLIKINDPYIPDSQIRNQILDNVKKFATSMLATDQEHFAGLITQGIEGGLSVDQIRMNITDDFSQYSKMQAERITRTEVMRTSIDSTLDAYAQSGVVEGKQWLTAGAVDECEDYDGQIEALDGNFYADTTEFADGDPPLHPNCRCVLLPVLLEEKSYQPKSNDKKLRARIVELEAEIDKRTKGFKELKAKSLDDAAYIKALEKYTDYERPTISED